MKFDYNAMTDEELTGLVHSLAAGTDEVEKSPEEAAEAAKILAGRGNAEGQYIYGTFLIHGTGVEKDEQAAGAFLCQSAEQGFAPALNHLGICCMAGACGFEENPAKAAAYFSAAAEKGFVESNVHLYGLYDAGKGVAKDKAKGLAFLQAACDADYYPACVMMGMEILQKSASSPEGQSEGVSYLLKAAEGGDPIGQLLYGSCCENGVGTEKDLSEAAGWYRKSAKSGNIQANEALKNLGFPGVM